MRGISLSLYTEKAAAKGFFLLSGRFSPLLPSPVSASYSSVRMRGTTVYRPPCRSEDGCRAVLVLYLLGIAAAAGIIPRQIKQ